MLHFGLLPEFRWVVSGFALTDDGSFLNATISINLVPLGPSGLLLFNALSCVLLALNAKRARRLSAHTAVSTRTRDRIGEGAHLYTETVALPYGVISRGSLERHARHPVRIDGG